MVSRLSILVFVLSLLLTTALGQVFTLTTSLSGSPLDGQVINAASQAFYLGLPGPATYCPTVVNPNCPNVTGTVFAGMSALWVRNIALLFVNRMKLIEYRSKSQVVNKSTSESMAH